MIPAVHLHEGDNRLSLRTMPENSIDAVVTDPPYSLTSITKRFGKPGSAAARTDKNDGSFARVSGGFMGKCYHPDTEILTSGGWKRVADFEGDEQVATLDPNSRDLVWQPVAQNHAYDFEGDLVRIAHRSAHQLVTPNHEVVLSVDGNRSLVTAEADGLPRKFHLTAQAAPRRGRVDPVEIVSTREYGVDAVRLTERATFGASAFFRFFGLWLGDGYTVTRSDDHPSNDYFGLEVTKARKRLAIRGALDELGIRYTETPKPDGGARFYCYNFPLLGFLKDIGKAHMKHIPSWMFDWDALLLEGLYTGLIDTDGCKQGKGQEVFYTSSRRLADDFQRLCLQTGRSASACFRPGGVKVVVDGVETVAADSWALCVLKPGKRLYAEAGTGRGSDVVSRVHYVGKVHCVGVARFHTLYTRFNGKPVWSGNSWDATGIERDPEFWAEVYRVLKPGGFVFAFAGARTGHWQATAMELAGFIMHPMHMWMYGCMDPETECLTRRGWSKYWEISTDDEVLQWDAATGALTWTRPEAIHEYPFDGEMVVLENRHTRQVLTPNHRVYAKIRRHGRHPKPTVYEVVEANDVDLRSSAWQVDLPLAGDLREGAAVDPNYAYLVGWWLTDAWPHRDANACCFSQCKPETLARLRAALEPCGASEYVKQAKKETHANEHSFYLTGPMADRLRSEFPDRALPWSVLGWDRHARSRLYRGLMDGDGSQPSENAGSPTYAHTFWSQDQDRRDVFMALALSLGMRCYEDAEKGAVYVNTTRDTTQLQTRHRSARMPYTGMVWCLTVPTGAFVVRRDGKPFITGNSGFPKGHDASKAIDKHLGTEDLREVVDTRYEARRFAPGATVVREGGYRKRDEDDGNEQTFAATIERGGSPEARQWDGCKYGTQTQKPAMEPIYLGQKPYDGKPVESILKWGVGAFDIDGCRVPASGRPARQSLGDMPSTACYGEGLHGSKAVGTTNEGRYPANVLLSWPADTYAPRDDLTDDEQDQLAAWLDANT